MEHKSWLDFPSRVIVAELPLSKGGQGWVWLYNPGRTVQEPQTFMEIRGNPSLMSLLTMQRIYAPGHISSCSRQII